MALITWQPAYETGIRSVDEQHQSLVKQINRLQKIAHKPSSDADVQEVIAALALYVRFHFREEELIMAENQYPELDHHAKLHRDFVHQVADYLKRLKQGQSIPVSELLAFLKSWLISHILREDKKLSIFSHLIPADSKQA